MSFVSSSDVSGCVLEKDQVSRRKQPHAGESTSDLDEACECFLHSPCPLHHMPSEETFVITHVLQVLSEDGKKIKRKQVFTERDKEELQVSS